MNPLERKVARLDNHFATRSVDYPIGTIFKEIESGATSLKNVHASVDDNSVAGSTEQARSLLSDGNQDAYKLKKREMPAFCGASTFQKGTRVVAEPSGLIVLDYDDVGDVPSVIADLSQNAHILAAFASMSNDGVKVVAIPDPMPSSDEYRLAWCAAKFLFDDIVGAEADIANSLNTSLTAITHDPNIYINENATPFEWGHIDAEDLEDIIPTRVDTQNGIGFMDSDELSEAHIETVRDMEFKENGWGKTMMPCVMSNHEHDGWDSRHNAMGVYRAKYHFTFRCFKCEGAIRVDRYVDPQRMPPLYAIERMPDAFKAYMEAYPNPDVLDVKYKREGLRVLVSVRSKSGDVYEVHGTDYILYHIGVDRPLQDWERDEKGRLVGKYAEHWKNLNDNLRKQFTHQSDRPANYTSRLFTDKGNQNE